MIQVQGSKERKSETVDVEAAVSIEESLPAILRKAGAKTEITVDILVDLPTGHNSLL